MVVDCGGGTVDITVHEADPEYPERMREVYKATGGPHGSIGKYYMLNVRNTNACLL